MSTQLIVQRLKKKLKVKNVSRFKKKKKAQFQGCLEKGREELAVWGINLSVLSTYAIPVPQEIWLLSA